MDRVCSMPKRRSKPAADQHRRRALCPFRDRVSLPEVMPERGELWRLSDGYLARVLLVVRTIDPRLSYAFVWVRMTRRNVPLQAFAGSAFRCDQRSW